MPKGFWIAVVNFCDGDFNPFALDFFARGGLMITETTPEGEWREGECPMTVHTLSLHIMYDMT